MESLTIPSRRANTVVGMSGSRDMMPVASLVSVNGQRKSVIASETKLELVTQLLTHVPDSIINFNHQKTMPASKVHLFVLYIVKRGGGLTSENSKKGNWKISPRVILGVGGICHYCQISLGSIFFYFKIKVKPSIIRRKNTIQCIFGRLHPTHFFVNR